LKFKYADDEGEGNNPDEFIFEIESSKFVLNVPQEARDIFEELSKSVKIERVELPQTDAFLKFMDYFVVLSNPSVLAKKLKVLEVEESESDSPNLLLLYQRQQFLEISSFFENIFVNWNPGSKDKLGSTTTKILEMQSCIALVKGALSKGDDSYFRVLGGDLRSAQVNSVLNRVCGNLSSYISNHRDIWKVFAAHVDRQPAALEWVFVDPHPETIQSFLEPEKVTLYFLDGSGNEKSSVLLHARKKIDLKQFGVKKKGHTMLNITGLEFMGIFFQTSCKYMMARNKTSNPLINSSELIYHAGEVCLSQTSTGIVCSIPIAQHVNKLAIEDSLCCRNNLLHQRVCPEESETVEESQTAPSMDLDNIPDFDPQSNKKSKKRLHTIKRMAKLGFQPWTFDQERDPLILEKNNSLGSLYVLRSEIDQDKNWKAIFKDVLFNDPGLNFFKVYFNVGTGDYFILMPSISNDLRYIARQISKIQSRLDAKLNQLQDLKDLKREMDQSLLNRLEMDHQSDDQKKDLLESFETAANVYWDRRVNLYKVDPLGKEISTLHLVSKLLVNKLHATSKLFETAFGTLVEPDFKADQKLLEKKPKELGKSWKKTASSLSHARLRNAVIRKQAVLGQCFVLCSEACSTLGCGFCSHPNSPGRMKIHSCNWSKCKKIGIRDFSGSVIARMALERCLSLARQSTQSKVRETEFPKLDAQSKVSKTTP